MFLSKSIFLFFALGFMTSKYCIGESVFFALINFAKNLFFKQGEHSLASTAAPPKRLKSPASIIRLFL